jgi:hypothetical protein
MENIPQGKLDRKAKFMTRDRQKPQISKLWQSLVAEHAVILSATQYFPDQQVKILH